MRFARIGTIWHPWERLDAVREQYSGKHLYHMYIENCKLWAIASFKLKLHNRLDDDLFIL